MNEEIDMLITQLEYREYIQQDYKHMIIDYLKKYKILQHQLEEKQKIIDEAIDYINKQIKDDYYCRKSSDLINKLLEILERGK